MVARLSLAIASLHVDEHEGHGWVFNPWRSPSRSITQKMELMVYVRCPRGCWKLTRAMTGTRAASHGVGW